MWKGFLDGLAGFAGDLIVAVVIFLGGWLLARVAARLTKRAISKGKVDALAASFFGSLVKAVVLAVAAVSAIAQLGVNITSLVAALGAAGLTASFALQGSLSNLVSGIQIIFTKPFNMGDYLAFGTYEGKVKKIEILSTTLATFDNKEVVIPNSMITSGVVVNYTSSGTRRLDLSYGVSYGADLKKAKALLQTLVESDQRVFSDPAPLIAVGELKDSSVTLVCKVWCKEEDYWSIYYKMQESVKEAFDREGIQIPFPQLDVHLTEQSKKEDG
ncbi:MAG: mechanosensitive ion channel family protein [Acutalibacter sp.]